MIYNNVLLHNVAECIQDQDGVRLQRIPEAVRQQVNENAQDRYLRAAGMEIRFLSAGDTVKVALTAAEGDLEIVPFFGGFQHNQIFQIKEGEKRTIELTYPERLALLDEKQVKAMPFSLRTWRLQLRGGKVIYHGIEGEGIRPPEETDLPKLKMIAYGTSITQGASASRGHLTYASVTARRLGADLYNLGTSGSAYCEEAIADYIASKDDWNLCLLCVSVNMVNQNFPLEVFQERASYLVRTIAEAHPEHPVFCMSILPYYNELPFTNVSEEEAAAKKTRVAQFRQALSDIAAGLPLKNIDGLSADLLHPGDFGMLEIGERLSERIHRVIKQNVHS